MKRVSKIFVLVIAITMFVACAKGTDEERVEILDNKSISSESITDLKLTIGTSPDDCDLFSDEHKSSVVEWKKYIIEAFNVNIDINYISPLNYANFINGSYLKDEIENENLAGLIKLSGTQIINIANLVNDGNILAINEYVKDNTYFNQLPESIVQPFKINENVYAIPSGNYCNPSVRLFNKEFLEKTESEVPTTLSELQEVLLRVKKQKLGAPLIINGNNYMFSIKDIFYASGCYPSYTGFSSISYDPLTKAYEDYMLKPEAISAFNYLSYLLDNQLAIVGNVSNLDSFVKSDVSSGSYYDTVWNYDEDIQDKYEMIWYLEGSNKMYLNALAPVTDAYVLSSKTENPNKVVNTFIDKFLDNKNGFLSMYFGLENDKYLLNGNVITSIENERKYEFVSKNTNILSNDFSYYNEKNELTFVNTNVLNSITEQLLNENIAFSTTLFPYSQDIKQSNAVLGFFQNIGEAYSWTFENYINNHGDIDIENMINEYKKEALKCGAQETLDELNELYKTFATYEYKNK